MILETVEKEALIKMEPIERMLFEKEHTFSEVIRILTRATHLLYLSLADIWGFETVQMHPSEPFMVAEPWKITLERTSSWVGEANSNGDMR